MKKNQPTSRLSLDRQTIRSLTAPETAAVHGAAANTVTTTTTATILTGPTLSTVPTILTPTTSVTVATHSLIKC